MKPIIDKNAVAIAPNSLASALFSPGRIAITKMVLDTLKEHNYTPSFLLARHLNGDWGVVSEEHASLNNQAVAHGFQIMSIFPITSKISIWVITESNRKSTTLLLPSEY